MEERVNTETSILYRQSHGHTDRHTDGSKDRQADASIPRDICFAGV